MPLKSRVCYPYHLCFSFPSTPISSVDLCSWGAHFVPLTLWINSVLLRMFCTDFRPMKLLTKRASVVGIYQVLKTNRTLIRRFHCNFVSILTHSIFAAFLRERVWHGRWILYDSSVMEVKLWICKSYGRTPGIWLEKSRCTLAEAVK